MTQADNGRYEYLSLRHRRRRLFLAAWTVIVVTLALTAATASAAVATLGHPGYLVLAAGRDTSAGYVWRSGPAADQRSLSWNDGVLVVPSSLELEDFGRRDLAIPVTAAFAGSGAGGALLFAEGRYPVSEPLLLTDGLVSFYAAAGDLEIVGERIRYSPPPPESSGGDPRAGYIFLAGMVLLVFVLMRRVRRGFKADRNP